MDELCEMINDAASENDARIMPERGEALMSAKRWLYEAYREAYQSRTDERRRTDEPTEERERRNDGARRGRRAVVSDVFNIP
jgi:hypothetical protein